MFELSITLAGNYNITPFELFKQDTDDVIMLANYLMEAGANSKEKEQPKVAPKPDNFWDF